MRWTTLSARGRALAPEELRVGQLGRLALVACAIAVGALAVTWSRTEALRTATELNETRARLRAALAERDRLRLEIAALADPARLGRAAGDLGLSADVRVVAVAPADGRIAPADGGIARR